MKITQQQLKQIIQEELQAELSEWSLKDLNPFAKRKAKMAGLSRTEKGARPRNGYAKLCGGRPMRCVTSDPQGNCNKFCADPAKREKFKEKFPEYFS